MPYLLGSDEAGYGPNLGPLVISVTAWQVDSLEQVDLFARLKGYVRSTEQPGNKAKATSNEVLIADSKDLYKPGKGLERLEQGVLACLGLVDKKPPSWQALFETLANEDCDQLSNLPWYQDFNDPLPIEAPKNQIDACADHLRIGCEQANCRLTKIASRVVFPDKFNTLCSTHGNKASALSHTTLQLVRDVLDRLPNDEPVFVLCDKHGGRNKYGPLLNAVFPESLAIVRQESRNESVYRLGDGNRRREIVFRAKGDAGFLPTALASMVSKYLRELAMRAFNKFWLSKVTDLRPTAGYPVDAKRFKQQIEPIQKKLGIADNLLWRVR